MTTLRYADRAKQIKNKPKINGWRGALFQPLSDLLYLTENPKDAMLREFQKQIEELRKQLENGGEDADR